MKRIRNLFARLKPRPGQNKKGASLALVVMIGAALVIWVGGILPMMMGTGDISYKTQGNYLSYLQDRSSIEFCKSQLEYIVRSEMPGTFAVTVDDNGVFTAVPKRDFMLAVQGDYEALVDTSQGTDDHGDVPWRDGRGDSVVAICSVTINDEGSYDIFVSTYDHGDLSMRYRVTFTPSGSLKIHPEAYNNGEALPLSDFVLVDGQLGSNKVWDSSITMSNAEKLTFNEHLLGVQANPAPGYADAGEYPAVFKTTALPTKENVEIMDPIDPGVFSTDELWIMPKYSDKDEGGLYYVNKAPGEEVKINLLTNNGSKLVSTDVTDRCTVYFNGKVSRSKTFPTDPGYYTVTVDFQGTDYSSKDNINKYDPNQTNVLPTSGLTLKAYDNTKTVDKQELEETATIGNIAKRQVEYKEGRYTRYKNVYDVTLALKDKNGNISNANDILYCCLDSDSKVIKTWQSSKTFTDLEANEDYFFFMYRPGIYDTEKKEFIADSDVKAAGSIVYKDNSINFNFTSNLTDGDYLIVSSSNQVLTGNGGTSALELPQMSDFVIMGAQPDNNLIWNASSSGSGDSKAWSFKNAATNQYIGASATYESGWFGSGSWKNIKFTFGASNNDNSYKWTLSNSGTAYRVQQSYTSNRKTTTLYWDYSSNAWKLTQTYNDDVRFLPLSSLSSGASVPMPTTPGNGYSLSDNSMSYGTAIGKFINDNLRRNGNATDATFSKVYANSELVADASNSALSGKLNAGSYEIIAILSNGQAVHLGTVAVSKAALTDLAIGNPVRHSGLEADDHCYDVSGTWDENAGVRYFGFEYDGTEYWFATAEDATTFRLKYDNSKPYYFAVRESGNNNYSGKTMWYGSTGGTRENARATNHTAGSFDLGTEGHLDFVYTLDANGKPTWYELPFGLDENRVTLVFKYKYEYKYSGWFGSSDSKSGEYWRTAYGDNYSYSDSGWGRSETEKLTQIDPSSSGAVGIIIDIQDSWFTTLRGETGGKSWSVLNSTGAGKVVFASPAGAKGNDSMLKGEALYFMGRNNSIDTRGNTILLDADLLVLYKDITGGGVVRLSPYTDSKTHALLYVGNDCVRNDVTVFHKGMFYLIPKEDPNDQGVGTNLMKVTAAQAKSWLVGYDPEEDGTKTQDELEDDNLEATKKLLRNGTYPEIIMDVALASAEQLSRIISSETIGWTKAGVLSGSSSDTNPAYVVTTFVESMSGAVSYKANRVMLAAHSNDADTLTVPANLTFTCRYLSLDMDNLVQGAQNVKFTIKNLGQDEAFIQLLGSWLGLTNYSSKSLQVDYERNMYICRHPNDGTNNVPAKKQIVRYDDKDSGVDLFTKSTDTKELIIVYTPEEVEELFNNGIISSLSSSVKIVDRYVSIEPTGNKNTSIDLAALLNAELDIYANYVYFSPKVTNISIESWLNADIRVNSQESGYTTQEYLGIFRRYSGDSYSGTILYFGADTTLNGNRNQTIKQGFYWVAATKDGTSLSKLVGITQANEKPNEIEFLTPEELSSMSVYIKTDGSINNSYVDTGLADNESTGLGGFSGGSVG